MALSQGKKRKSETNDKSEKRTKSNRNLDEKTIIEKQRNYLAFKQFLNRPGPEALGSKIIPQGAQNSLRSLTFVITGVLPSLEREECRKLIENYGGRVTTAVSGKTNFLISGRDAGKSKTEKANKLRVKIISEDDLIEMIRTRPENKTIEKKKQIKNRIDFLQIQKENSFEEKENEENLLWIDKYKPKGLNEILGQQTDKSPMKKLIYFLSNWSSAKHRGVLLTGPSGSGKTTTARLVCKALNLSFIENQLTSSKFIEKSSISSKQVLIFDELENNEKFELGKIVEHLKKLAIPIIFISNDRSSSKVRKLSKFCEEIRFQRVSLLNIKSRLMEICSNERIRLNHFQLDRLIEISDRDLRKTICNLHFYSAKSSKVLINFIKSDQILPSNSFDVCSKLFNKENFNVAEKQNLYFFDCFLLKFFIHENYLRVVPSSITQRLELIYRAADSLAYGDVFSKLIFNDSNRTLFYYESFFSGVIPATYLHGSLSTVVFPKYLNLQKKENFHFEP